VATITAVSPSSGRGAVSPAAGGVPSRLSAAWRSHREAVSNAAAVRDPFLDVIVMLSVLVFLALAVGVGVLVLGPVLHWPS
jgi:hypothetical protein